MNCMNCSLGATRKLKNIAVSTTRFIDLDLPLSGSAAADLPHQVEIALRQWGEPLRWAITRIDRSQQTAHIEAIVTVEN